MSRFPAPPVIAIVCPDSALVDAAGSLQVIRCQIEAVRRAGGEPILVAAAPSIRPTGTISESKSTVLKRRAGELGVPLAAILPGRQFPSHLPAYARILARSLLRRPFGPETDVDLARLSKPRHAVDDDIRPDAVIVNYLAGAAIADVLVPRSRQILVLHDVPTQAPSRALLALLEGYPLLMTLNRDEAARLETFLPGARIHSGLQIMPDKLRSRRSDPPLSMPLSAVFKACGARTIPAGKLWDGRSHVDLLFVGGRHGPNLEGLRAFLTDCYLPRLAPGGVTMAIAGTSGEAVADLVADHPHVALAGACRTLDPLYEAARLVIVPLLSGTGTSTKTLEAVEMGKPILATPAGLRGLGLPRHFALPASFDGSWASRIMELLDNPGERRDWALDLLRAVQGPSMEAVILHVLPHALNDETAEPLPTARLVDELGAN